MLSWYECKVADSMARAWESHSLQPEQLACPSQSWTTARSHWIKALHLLVYLSISNLRLNHNIDLDHR